MSAKRLFISIGILLVLILASFFALFAPPSTQSLVSLPHLAQDYPTALARLETLNNQNTQALHPDCRPQVMDHGKRVDHVIVFIHGFTNCPKQFSSLAETFYQQGYNVLNLPLPHHGLVDRMTDEVEKIKAEDLAAYADETVDIAQGLGEHVTVVGFSAGGVVGGWIAQTRGEVDSVVLVSPGFGLQPIPTQMTLAASRLVSALPSMYRWVEPEKKEQGGRPHTYPRYSFRALAQLVRLGFVVHELARQSAPQVSSITIVINGNETKANNEMTDQMAQIWSAHAVKITRYEFDRSLELPHEIIDPTSPHSRTDIVYPLLIPLIQEALVQ